MKKLLSRVFGLQAIPQPVGQTITSLPNDPHTLVVRTRFDDGRFSEVHLLAVSKESAMRLMRT